MRKLYAMVALLLGVHYANGQCTGGISVSPTSGYTENFNAGAGGWTSGGSSSTWVLGNQSVFSQKANINTPFGGTGSAWVTSDTLAGGTRNRHKANENSFVTSPCLDFTNVANPVIRIKIWYQSEANVDGTALQYSTNNGATWQSVGSLNDPDNWYNSNVSSKPGGQNAGWSGNSGGWLTAQHDLTGAGGQSGVKLRFAFKSDIFINGDGFAFDDVEIFNKPDVDLGVTSIIAPTSGCGATDSSVVTITVKNFGAVAQSNVPVSYSFTGAGTGGTTNPEIIPGPIAPGATVTYTFTQTANLLAGGTYTFTATASKTGDAQTSNDTFLNYDVTNITAISTFPYREDFENAATATDWTSGGTNSSWEKGTPAKSVISGTTSGSNAWVTGRTGTHNSNEKSYVESRCFDFSQMLLPVIEMNIWWDSNIEDGAVLQGSIDGGNTWMVIGNYNDPDNWYNNNTILGAPGGQPIGWAGQMSTSTPAGSGSWVLARHDMPTLAQQKNVKLRIAFGSNASTNYDGFAFDDIVIYDKPEVEVEVTRFLQPFSGCQLSSQEFVAIELKNNGSRTQRNFWVYFNYTGPNSGLDSMRIDSLLPGETKGFRFPRTANLSAQGTYRFNGYIGIPGDIIQANDTVSNYEVSNIQVVVTPTQPYIQDFENGRGGWDPAGLNSSWEFGTPAKSVIRGAASGNNAWVTGGLGNGTYNATEFSYIVSPCMSFANITNPVIQMKAWWSSEFNVDGAVLQYSLNGPAGPWVTIGDVGDPNNWYNSGGITGNPGGQQKGWTGEGQRSSNGWVLVQNELTGLGGNGFVTLRVAFGSNTTNQGDGFGFDDVTIFQKPSNDVAIVSIPPIPQNCGFTNCERIQVEIHNNGSSPITNLPLTYTLGNNAPVTQTFAGPFTPGSKHVLQFSACADLSAIGAHPITVTANYPGDELSFNNTFSTVYQNALFNSLPLSWTFETNSQNNFGEFRVVTNANSSVYTSAAAGFNSSNGIIMDGGASTPWTDVPAPAMNPWNQNLDHLAGVYFCVDLTGSTQPELSFNLKQVAKGLFSNTSFRVTVNGVQHGPSYQPPVNLASNWNRIVIDLSPYKNLGIARIGLESSVRESYRSGAGHGNLVDSIVVAEHIVGLNEKIDAKQISIFPNPTNGVFQVAVSNDFAQNYQLEVLDLSGRIIKTATLNQGTNQTQLDMSGHAKGVYILKVIGENSIATKKLLLQ